MGVPRAAARERDPVPLTASHQALHRVAGALLKKRESADLSKQRVLQVSWLREGLVSPKANQTGKKRISETFSSGIILTAVIMTCSVNKCGHCVSASWSK